MQQLQAAVALHNQGDLDQAEVIYRSVLTVDANNFYALNFCGCICREQKRFDEGIALLGEAVSLQPGNPDVVYNLGNVFKDAERWDEAIACYEKTLGLRAEYPEALNNLGICLMEVERYEHSKIVLKHAVSMQPDFAGAWLNLGNTFKAQEKFEEAIASYRKAIEVKPDFSHALTALAQCLMDAGRVSESLVVYEKCSQLNPWDPSNCETPARKCDSFWKSSGDLRLSRLAVDLYAKSFQIRPPVSGFVFDSQASVVASARIGTIAQSLPENAELLPSFKSFDPKGWLSLYYLHIPKNGGIRFTVPLQECIRLYENSLYNGRFDAWRDAIELRHAYKRFTALRLNNQSLHDAFLESLSSSEPDHNIDWSLVMSHGSWSSLELQQRIAEVTGQMPFRVGTWREPRERFLSALHYLYREASGSLERVVKELSDKDPFLHNTIYRHISDCFDGGFEGRSGEFAVDCLLELGDHTLLNRLQSSFLSRNRLPNLIVSKRFNVTKNNYRMSADDEARLLDEFYIDDFVCMDDSDAVNSLRTSELPPELSCHPSGDELHPLTVIVSDATKQSSTGYQSEICLTADLVGERGCQKLQGVFSGKNI